MKSHKRIRSWEITSESNYRNRRKFLRDAGLALGGLATASALPAFAQVGPASLDTVPWPGSSDEQPNSWQDITTYNNFYEFGTAKEDPYRNAQKLHNLSLDR